MRPVADDENLNIFVEAGCCPETISLVAIDLVECFTNSHSATFQFRMDHRKAVHEDCHIVPIVMPTIVIYILVDDLQAVVMDAPAVNQSDILCRSVVALKDLHIVLLNHPRLLNDTVIRIGKNAREKLFPFGITEGIVVKKFQLVTQVPGQVFFFMNLQILVSLPGQQGYELVLEVGFGLIGFRS